MMGECERCHDLIDIDWRAMQFGGADKIPPEQMLCSQCACLELHPDGVRRCLKKNGHADEHAHVHETWSDVDPSPDMCLGGGP